ncbi:MAG: mechanosensitive ion channel family protein, partial [Halobaculum sp.]
MTDSSTRFPLQSGSLLPEWLQRLVDSAVPTTEAQVAATVLIVVVLAVLAVLNRRAGPVLKQRYDDPLVELAQGVAMLVGLTAAAAAIVVVWRGTDDVAQLFGTVDFTGIDLLRTILSVLLLSLAYTATRLTKRAIYQLGDRRGALTEHQMEISHHVAQVGIYVFTLLVVLGMWGVDVSGLLVGAGFAGIVLGLAARQTLGAVLAGFVVLFSRPFELGDWVVIGDQEGVVTDITIVNTRLRTFDDEVVMIPNDIVTSEEVLNRTRNGRLRINVDVGVDYETDLQQAMELAEE